MTLLSLCMITKDEETYLQGCLESVRDVVDEIVLVDTGSTDRTVEIAERFGAKVLHFPWAGDFSEARNVSLEAASGDWLLVLDADERLETNPKERLGQLLSMPNAAGFSLVCENRVGPPGSTDVQLAPVFRLFRNHLGIRFEGMIHEQAIASAKRTGLTTYASDLRIVHLGYQSEAVALRDKRRRNLSLLEQQIEREPGNPFVHFNLGEVLKLLERLPEAEAHYRQALSLLKAQGAVPRLSYFANLYFSLSDVLRRQGAFEAALSLLEEAIARYPDYPDLHYLKGHTLCEHGKPRLALASFERCLGLAATLPAFPTDPDVTGYKAHLGLADCFIRLAEDAAAYEHLEAALRLQASPGAETLTNLGILLSKRGDVKGAKERFEEALSADPDHVRAWLNLGASCFEHADYPAAVVAWEHVLRLAPSTPEVRLLLAESRVKLGAPAQALQDLVDEVDLALDAGRTQGAQAVLDRLDEWGPVVPDLEFSLGHAFDRRGFSDVAIGCYLRAQQRTPDYAEPYQALGDLCLRLGKTEDATVMFERAAELSPQTRATGQFSQNLDAP